MKLEYKAVLINILILVFALGILAKKVVPTKELIARIEQHQKKLFESNVEILNPLQETVSFDNLSKTLEDVQFEIISSIEKFESLKIMELHVRENREKGLRNELIVTITGSQQSLLEWYRLFDSDFLIAKRNGTILENRKGQLYLEMSFSLINELNDIGE